MRNRVGNPYDEFHGKSLRVYDFVADGTKSPHDICLAAETATGLRLRGDPAGQDGYINTSLRPDGSVFVSIVLYEACSGLCGGHAVPHRRAADITPAQRAAVKVACKEHPQHKLGGPNDAATLRGLGFTDADGAMR